ncbi:MAG TPA: type VI secretion system protein TssA [Phycisphaerae bacterium]|jgi:type VI secretion system protein VasJ
MATFDEALILALGKEPIPASAELPGAGPSGIDPADDVQYIAVTAEIGKLDRIEAGDPDWHQIELDACEILRSKSKDMEVATALAHALFKQYGYAGLATGLTLLVELTNHFWEKLYPERPRRRKARIEALAERFADGGWFRANAPKKDEFDAVDRCAKLIDELKAALTAKLPDDPPNFSTFVRGIKELAARRPQASAAPVTSTTTAGGAPAGGDASFAAGEIKDTGSAISAVLAAATHLRKADSSDALPYAIVRAVKWAGITLPTTEAGKFQIPAPEGQIIETLTHQVGAGLWENLLRNAEGAFRSNDPLWLDLQRYVCAAMAALGTRFDRARQTILSMTAALVQRLGPGLFELKFKNGTPLCGGETRMWIESELAPAGGDRGGAEISASNGKLTEATDKARKLAGSGKLKEALTELQQGLLACQQRRDRFLWRLRIAQLCFDAAKLQLAAPLLEECFEEIQRYHIDEWEPLLAVEVAQALYRCRKSLTSGQKEPAREALQGVRDSFAWLCQLDPLAALAVEPASN